MQNGVLVSTLNHSTKKQFSTVTNPVKYEENTTLGEIWSYLLKKKKKTNFMVY